MLEKMILRDLIKNYGRLTTVRTKSTHSNRYYEQKELDPGSKEELIAMVTEWFEERGWKTKFLKRTSSYTSRVPKGHAKINWEIGSGHGNVYSKAALWSKTPNGGWTTVTRSWRSGGDLSVLVKQAQVISKPTMVTKETLPPSFPIGALDNYHVDRDSHTATLQNKWRWVRVNGVVGLKKDGTISTTQVFSPDENPWFHCLINDHSGSSANIITDGDKLHPLNKRTYKGERKFRVTTNVPSFVRSSTVRDKELLELAISTFFK